MKRPSAPPKGIRAAVALETRLRGEWPAPAPCVGGGGASSDLEKAKAAVRQQVRELEEEYKSLLQEQRKDKKSAPRGVSEPHTLYFTPPVEVDHNPLHLRWSLQIHQAEHPDNYWANCQFVFEAVFPVDYPNVKPLVQCKTRLFHPNIDDETGKVCLSLLNDGGWITQPSGGLPRLSTIVSSIFTTLFQDPNGNDSLPGCKEAADLILTNREEFRRRAKAHSERYRTFIPGAF
jgi:ubiquitin-protein ligase